MNEIFPFTTEHRTRYTQKGAPPDSITGYIRRVRFTFRPVRRLSFTPLHLS